MRDFRVRLRPSYPVRTRATFAQTWDALRQDHPDRPVMLVVDRRLAEKNSAVLRSMPRAWRSRMTLVPGGETCKHSRWLNTLWRQAVEHRVDRNTLVIAVGGGTVGDLTGFFAASYLRGLDWCPVATTVLAMADSAVGGKTGLNLEGRKNLVGAFHQPRGVYSVQEALRTLPRRHRISGLAEVIKSAVIGDAKLFARIEREGHKLGEWDHPLWSVLVHRASAIKANVVAEDPLERGRRAILNFGHTYGHALETVVRPRLHHGEAVALGMIAACFLSEWSGRAPAGTLDRVESVLAESGLPVRTKPMSVASIMDAMRYDKKSEGGRTRMVLTDDIGSASFGHIVDDGSLRRAARFLTRRQS